MPAARACLRAHFNQPVCLGKHLGVVVHQQHRISVCHKVPHYPGQALQVRGVKPNGRFVQYIQHAGGAVAHCAGQLHALALACREGGGCAA